MSGLRERIAEAIGMKMAGASEHGKYYGKEADAALATFRQWMEERTGCNVDDVLDQIFQEAAAAPTQPGEK